MTKALTVTATALSALALTLTTSPASSAVLEHRHFVDSGSEPFTFCEGMNAEVSWHDRVHELITTQGPDGLVHFSANVRGTRDFLNLDTGIALTNTHTFHDRDVRVTDNGDGTLTIIFMDVGVNKWYVEGTRIFVTAGQFRAEIVVDHGGTPTDPSDDTEVSFEVLKTPMNDPTADRDFCADFAEFTA